MSTITKESIEDTIEGLEHLASSGIQSVYIDMAIAGMRRLQASLEAEPVAWRCDSGSIANRRVVTVSKVVADSWGEKGMKVSPLYAAPPEPLSVPDEVNVLLNHLEDVLPDEAFNKIDVKTWNNVSMLSRPDVYRDAMLQGADERHVVRSEHAEWSQSTFGDVGPVGPLKHLSKEALEAAAEPGDLSEWADMQFLLWDAQRRAGITDEQITLAMIDKLAVNKARNWPEPKDGEPRLHIKAAPQQEVKNV